MYELELSMSTWDESSLGPKSEAKDSRIAFLRKGSLQRDIRARAE